MIKVRKCHVTGKWFYHWDNPGWWMGWYRKFETWEEVFAAAQQELDRARKRLYHEIFCSTY